MRPEVRERLAFYPGPKESGKGSEAWLGGSCLIPVLERMRRG